MERWIGTGVLASIAAPVAAARKCPLCGRAVSPDTLGFLECVCGWGGPDDPLETARGLAGVFMRLDRRMANAIARRDLRAIASRKGPPAADGFLYTLVLLLASTCIHLVMYGALIGLIILVIHLVHDQAWVGAGLSTAFAALFLAAVVHWRGRTKGIWFSPAQLPHLNAAVREVSERVHAPLPHRIILEPGTRWAVFQQHPLRRFFLPERVLIVGVGALPLLTMGEVKAILAHELAHYKYAHTALHRYISSAELEARYIIDLMLEAASSQYRRMRTRRIRSYASSVTDVGALVVWIIALPLALLWQGFHLLRLASSRHDEFRADAAATSAYGADAFIGGLAGIIAARKMLYGGSIRAHEKMLHGEASVYAEMRHHIAALPAHVIKELRFKALYAFRSLEHSHPAEPDRARAAMLVDGGQVYGHAESADATPATDLIVPDGESSADEIEKRLTRMTRMLFA